MLIYEVLFYISIAAMSYMFVTYVTNRLQDHLNKK